MVTRWLPTHPQLIPSLSAVSSQFDSLGGFLHATSWFGGNLQNIHGARRQQCDDR